MISRLANIGTPQMSGVQTNIQEQADKKVSLFESSNPGRCKQEWDPSKRAFVSISMTIHLREQN
jgi:hypothetical protein